MTQPQQLFSPYETNTSRPKNDRSSYTAEMFMEDRGFTETERQKAKRAARICLAYREHLRATKGERETWDRERPWDAAYSPDPTRHCQIMNAAIMMCKEAGEPFSMRDIRKAKAEYDQEAA